MMTLPRNLPHAIPPILPMLLPLLPATLYIAGRMGAGKSTVAAALCAAEPGYTRLALADALKQDICNLYGITRAEMDANKGKYRSGLQFHGQHMRDLHGDRYWIQRWEKVRAHIPGPVVCDDVRYPNEALWARTRGMLVRVWVPAATRQTRLQRLYGAVTPAQLNHASERDVDALAVDLELRGDLPSQLILPSLCGAFGALMAA